MVWRGKSFIYDSQELLRNPVISIRRDWAVTRREFFPCMVTFYPSILCSRCPIETDCFGEERTGSLKSSTICTVSELRSVHLVKLYMTSPAQWILNHYIYIAKGLKINYENQSPASNFWPQVATETFQTAKT